MFDPAPRRTLRSPHDRSVIPMKNSYRKHYRRDGMARPSSYATGFVIPRHAGDANAQRRRGEPAHFVSRDRAQIASAQPLARIETGGRTHHRRANPLRYAEAVAKVASIVLTAGNGVLLTVLFG
ncbi:MAG TPA: hypothetical protein VHF86_02360 [Xanthomonadaceae bacterium]|nr:hypothetical protein [Xanthomonadaceae bacterium]